MLRNIPQHLQGDLVKCLLRDTKPVRPVRDTVGIYSGGFHRGRISPAGTGTPARTCPRAPGGMWAIEPHPGKPGRFPRYFPILSPGEFPVQVYRSGAPVRAKPVQGDDGKEFCGTFRRAAAICRFGMKAARRSANHPKPASFARGAVPEKGRTVTPTAVWPALPLTSSSCPWPAPAPAPNGTRPPPRSGRDRRCRAIS